jgi:hypothetical protein
MATTLEIIQGISQAAGYVVDCGHGPDGEPIKVGLRREEGNPTTDKRVMDGFSVKMSGNMLCVSYHCEPPLKEIHNSNFENEVAQTVAKCKGHIQKQYKSITGRTLGLKEDGEIQIRVEYISRIRTSVTAYQMYRINAIKNAPLQESIRNWISQK